MSLSRRDFVKLGTAASVFSIVGATAKSGRADGPARAKRVLIVNANGGLRSHASLYALAPRVHNPWGIHGKFGALSLGNILFDPAGLARISRTSSWPGVAQIPDLRQVAPNMAVIGAVHHAPGAFRQGDHSDDSARMGTGYFDAASPGLVTVLNKFLGAGAANAPSAPLASIGVLGNGPFSIARGPWAAFAPTPLVPSALPDAEFPEGSADVGRPIEDKLDERFRARHAGGPAAAIAADYLARKTLLRRYSQLFVQNTLHLGNPTFLDAAKDGVTNRMLLEAMGAPVVSAPQVDTWSAALAIRLLQYGAPAICANLGAFDLHSGEVTQAPIMYPRFAQILAGIYFALSKIPSGDGTLLDSTLVVTTSEFGRTAKGDSSGFFAGKDGSEHWASYQPHVVFGAGVKPKTIAPIDDENNPTRQSHSTQSLLSTIGTALGVPAAELEKLWPSGTPLHPETTPLLDLWA